MHRVGDDGRSSVAKDFRQRLLAAPHTNLTGAARCAQGMSERSESEGAEDPSTRAPTKPSRRVVDVRWSGPGLDLVALDDAGLMAWRFAVDI